MIVRETGVIIGIQCGSFLPTVDGRTRVDFPRKFAEKPVVTVTMEQNDFKGFTNNAIIIEITNTYFIYVYGKELNTHDESQLTINWIAIATAP